MISDSLPNSDDITFTRLLGTNSDCRFWLAMYQLVNLVILKQFGEGSSFSKFLFQWCSLLFELQLQLLSGKVKLHTCPKSSSWFINSWVNGRSVLIDNTVACVDEGHHIALSIMQTCHIPNITDSQCILYTSSKDCLNCRVAFPHRIPLNEKRIFPQLGSFQRSYFDWTILQNWCIDWTELTGLHPGVWHLTVAVAVRTQTALQSRCSW